MAVTHAQLFDEWLARLNSGEHPIQQFVVDAALQDLILGFRVEGRITAMPMTPQFATFVEAFKGRCETMSVMQSRFGEQQYYVQVELAKTALH